MKISYRLIVIVLLIILLTNCGLIFKQKGYNKFVEICKLMDNFQYKDAIKELNELERINPDFYDDLDTIPLYYGICYESIGDIKTAVEEYNKAIDFSTEKGLFKKSLMKKYAGYTLFDSSITRIYIKTYKLEKAKGRITSFYNLLSKNNNKHMNDFLFNMERDANVDFIIIDIIGYKGIIDSKEKLDFMNHILNDFFNEIIKMDKKKGNIEHIGTSHIERSIFDLLSYKMEDDKFYSDVIWDLDITKKYFDIYFERGILTKETLNKMKKYVVAKDKLPDNFVKLFDNPKCK